MVKRISSVFVVIAFLILGGLPAWGQTDDDAVDSQFWIDLILFNEYSNKIEFYGDGGYRRVLRDRSSWNRVYVRPAIKYSPLSWLGLRAGVGLFYTGYPTARSHTLEVRPWQGVSVSWPKFPRIRFSHYLRMEQRLIYETETWDRSYDLRFRYQLSTRIQPNINKKVKYFYFPAFAEFFADQTIERDVNDLFADDLRLGGGLGYTLNNHWSVQFVLIFQQSRADAGNFSTSDLLFRFTFKHELVPNRDMQRIDE